MTLPWHICILSAFVISVSVAQNYTDWNPSMGTKKPDILCPTAECSGYDPFRRCCACRSMPKWEVWGNMTIEWLTFERYGIPPDYVLLGNFNESSVLYFEKNNAYLGHYLTTLTFQ